MDTSKAVTDWLDSLKSEGSRKQYKSKWQVWLEYSKAKGLPENGDLQLEDMKKRRTSTDNTIKYFYDNEVPKFFNWLTTEYIGKQIKDHLSEYGAQSCTTTVRSFFAYHRYTLEIKKEALPSTDKMVQKYEDHAFDIYQLRSMFNQGDLRDRAILACGKDLWLRVGDFAALNRETFELYIKRENEIAENEKREPDIIEFELITEKEKEPACCHLSKETIALLSEYLKTHNSQSEKLFPLNEEALTDVLRKLAEKAKITVTGRIRWHCLRKFGITLMHGKIQEPVMKYMTGKHIDKSLKTYIQGNREAYKAFKLIEPLISLTKSNGNGNSSLVKELEELKKERFKTLMMLKLMEKITPKDEMQKALKELAEELGIEKTEEKKLFVLSTEDSTETNLETVINTLAKAYEKKDLERVLKENGNGE